jgi:uncharacterized membrane protein YgcG
MKVFGRCVRVGALLAVLATVLFPLGVSAAQDPAGITIHAFEGDYYLTRDADKRSHLKVVERLNVQFPPSDVKHGIERAIPQEYDGHKVNLEVASVKDDKGKSWPYTTYTSNNNTVLRIGDPKKFVHNQQVYIIEYKQRDVTKAFAGHDELYWDTNGTEWGLTFGSVTGRLHLKGDIAKAYQGRNKCYEGSVNSTSKCTITENKTADETVLTFKSSRMLYAGENVSFVTAFDKDTFTGYQKTTWEKVYPWLLGSWIGSGVLVLVFMSVKLWRAWQRFGRSPSGKGAIVPEYLPPKDMSVLTASVIIKKDGKDETAEIIDLAVRHYLKIYESETKGSWFSNKKSFEIELIKATKGLRIEEKKLIELIFGSNPQIGSRVTVEALKSKLYKGAASLQKDTTEANALLEGYLADRSAARRRYYVIGGVLVGLGFVLLNPGVALAGVVTLIVASSFHPLTEKGVETRDYLRGLEMYMKLAEAERLRVLQSPSGAVKTPVDASNKKKLVKLYERLLPYAIIFGLEKEWAKEFAPLYDGKQPDWYVGNWAAFNAAAFVSSINGFTAASNSSFSDPSNSSSSGMGGGGFSGGGGGGGGGGSW